MRSLMLVLPAAVVGLTLARPTLAQEGFDSPSYGGLPPVPSVPEPSDAADQTPATSSAPTTQMAQRPTRVDVQRYLELQEKYAQGLSQNELANRAVQVEQAVRNQEVARRIAELEDEVRRLLGDAVGTPSEQTVTDLLKVLEARHSVPRGQQVYFEKKYRTDPRSRPSGTAPVAPSPPSTTRAYPPQTSYPPTTYPQSTYPQSTVPTTPAPTWQRPATTYGY